MKKHMQHSQRMHTHKAYLQFLASGGYQSDYSDRSTAVLYAAAGGVFAAWLSMKAEYHALAVVWQGLNVPLAIAAALWPLDDGDVPDEEPAPPRWVYKTRAWLDRTRLRLGEEVKKRPEVHKAKDDASATPPPPEAELPSGAVKTGVVNGYRTYLKAMRKKEELESAVSGRVQRLWAATGARCCTTCVNMMMATPCVAACVASLALYVAVLLELTMGLTALGDGFTLVTEPPATLAAVLLLSFATLVQMADTVSCCACTNPVQKIWPPGDWAHFCPHATFMLARRSRGWPPPSLIACRPFEGCSAGRLKQCPSAQVWHSL